jgi:hypothetical protein
MKKFYVTGITGGYVEKFDWLEAETIAIDESKGSVRFIMDEDNHIAALFYDGQRYIKASGQSCEQCGKAMDTDSAHYAYHLTSRFFCSSDCGVKLGVLVKGNDQ